MGRDSQYPYPIQQQQQQQATFLPISTKWQFIIIIVLSCLFQVLFKRVVGNATGSQVSLFLSCLGVLDLLFLWPIIVVFHFTKYELIDWGDMPWLFLCGTGFLALIFNFLLNFGIALTYPLFISLGTVLGIPINALADLVFRGKDFGPFKIIAAVFIVLGFLFMLLPDEYEDTLQSKICCCKNRTSGHENIAVKYKKGTSGN